ncbi:hypothetical protein HELRODRAFT_173975 [Helobdella robusta]|uniref:Uncharacterized protein n=1 Tax=Helobdella robusta TaxID=6412 RepID=T1F7F6_HELRO|nr:hypothetical protein HELRODRAFT_173975 [Helobdella robusta]ESO03092.1 hypothetical protein HELRODRAFT_173975 [Helobdella robusta]
MFQLGSHASVARILASFAVKCGHAELRGEFVHCRLPCSQKTIKVFEICFKALLCGYLFTSVVKYFNNSMKMVIASPIVSLLKRVPFNTWETHILNGGYKLTWSDQRKQMSIRNENFINFFLMEAKTKRPCAFSKPRQF